MIMALLAGTRTSSGLELESAELERKQIGYNLCFFFNPFRDQHFEEAIV
jgi:hypothetical protein